jgi:hypothetical protein
MTQVRFDWVELKQIAAVMELLDDQSQSNHISQFAGGTLEWFTGDECEGWIEWVENQFWFVPVSNIAAGELDEYRELHKKNQQEIYRLGTQVALFTELLDDGYTNWGWQQSWTTERQMEFDALKRRPGWESRSVRDYELHWNKHHKVFYRVASEDIDIEARQLALDEATEQAQELAMGY